MLDGALLLQLGLEGVAERAALLVEEVLLLGLGFAQGRLDLADQVDLRLLLLQLVAQHGLLLFERLLEQVLAVGAHRLRVVEQVLAGDRHFLGVLAFHLRVEQTGLAFLLAAQLVGVCLACLQERRVAGVGGDDLFDGFKAAADFTGPHRPRGLVEVGHEVLVRPELGIARRPRQGVRVAHGLKQQGTPAELKSAQLQIQLYLVLLARGHPDCRQYLAQQVQHLCLTHVAGSAKLCVVHFVGLLSKS